MNPSNLWFGGDEGIEGGTKNDVKRFFSFFDKPVDVGAINLIVR